MVPDCGQNSRYDHTVNSCVCIITGMIQGTGTEGCTCPANMVLNEILATCVCNQVSYLLKGLCVECWSNARPVADQSTCVCQDTFYETSPEVCEPSPLLTASGMACKPIPEDLLQSGIMTFTASNLKNVRENCLNVQINFNPPNNGISNIVCTCKIIQL